MARFPCPQKMSARSAKLTPDGPTSVTNSSSTPRRLPRVYTFSFASLQGSEYATTSAPRRSCWIQPVTNCRALSPA